jgi:hypothetical protein
MAISRLNTAYAMAAKFGYQPDDFYLKQQALVREARRLTLPDTTPRPLPDEPSELAKYLEDRVTAEAKGERVRALAETLADNYELSLAAMAPGIAATAVKLMGEAFDKAAEELAALRDAPKTPAEIVQQEMAGNKTAAADHVKALRNAMTLTDILQSRLTLRGTGLLEEDFATPKLWYVLDVSNSSTVEGVQALLTRFTKGMGHRIPFGTVEYAMNVQKAEDAKHDPETVEDWHDIAAVGQLRIARPGEAEHRSKTWATTLRTRGQRTAHGGRYDENVGAMRELAGGIPEYFDVPDTERPRGEHPGDLRLVR